MQTLRKKTSPCKCKYLGGISRKGAIQDASWNVAVDLFNPSIDIPIRQKVSKRVFSFYLADKNEPSRFLGDGVTFKAKLIGILEVEEARGDRMCQEALFELKMAVRAAGEHKQRINIVIAIDGIRLRDEKTGVSMLFDDFRGTRC